MTVVMQLEWTNVSMTVVMQLELTLKYSKVTFKSFKVFTGLGLPLPTTFMVVWVAEWPVGWVACLKLELKLTQPHLKLKLT